MQPPLEQAAPDDWLVLSIPAPRVTGGPAPTPRPAAEWFAHLEQVRTGSEREVEMHIISPLFEQLGYRQDQEAAAGSSPPTTW